MSPPGLRARLSAADLAWRRPRGGARAGRTPKRGSSEDEAFRQAAASENTSSHSGEGAAQDMEGGESAGHSHEVVPPSGSTLRFGIFQVVMLGLFMLFVFLLPIWSWLLNDKLGEVGRLCATPASELACGGGVDYGEVAARLGRTGRSGELVGCGCGEGALADWSCPPESGYFSISYFISTPPGTGAMAALSGWPILAQWIHGVGDAELFCKQCSSATATSSLAYAVMWYSQLGFQFFYGLFLINTLCVQPLAHAIVVGTFIVGLIVHFITLAIVMGIGTKAGKLIVSLSAIGIITVLMGYFFPVGSSWFSQHALWLGECIGLSCAFAVMPVLNLLRT